jgi:hypothetical protein
MTAHRAKAQPAQQQGEPVYFVHEQITGTTWGSFLIECDKARYDQTPEHHRRILYTTSPSFEQAKQMAAEICKKRHGPVYEILSMSPPSDSVVMTKAELLRFAVAVGDEVRRATLKHRFDVGDETIKEIIANVSRAMEGK